MPDPSSNHQRRLFEEIVHDHGAALSRLCGGYERVPAKREELMQEILLALWRSLESFRGDASLRTWMYRVAHNVATTHVHRASRRQKASDEQPSDRPAPGSGADEQLDEALQLKQLRRAIQTLKPFDRQIILLVLEEIPQAEIAAIVGISVANVSTRVGRIKKALARTLAARTTP